ncbi:MAG: transposase, partial [Treponema sp.]|nr:transposase [Treponema sp.]
RELLEDGKPVSQVAESHGVHPNLVLNWRRERSSRSSCSRERRRHSRYGGLTLPGRRRSGRPKRWKKSHGRRTALSPNWRGK